MKLYYVPRTRASRPRWVLEELGVPYDLVRLDPAKGETRAPEHLAALRRPGTTVDEQLVEVAGQLMQPHGQRDALRGDDGARGGQGDGALLRGGVGIQHGVAAAVVARIDAQHAHRR